MGGGASKRTVGEVQVAATADGRAPKAAVISAEVAAEAAAPGTGGTGDAAAAAQVIRPKGQQEVKRPRPTGGVRKTKDKPGDAVEEGVSPPTRQAGFMEAEAAAAAEASPEAPAAAPQPPPAAVVSDEIIGEPRRQVTVDEFIAACRQGDEATVQAFLTVNARTSRGLAEREEALFDSYGDSVLHHAVQGGSGKVLELLLDLGRVQVDIPNARNETALQLACRRGDAALVRRLLQAQADPDRRDAGGLTPFLSAVFAGGGAEILEQLSKAHASVGAQDARGVGALHFAALRGDSNLMDWLLMRKASPDAQTEHSTTPLMLAAKRGHTDGVSLLLGCKANTTLADEAGCTALMHALSSGSVEAAQKLLDGGASVDAVDCAGRSPLFHAVLGGQADGLKAVIARGGRINILDEEGRSPLYQACLMGERALAKSLLEADADPNLAGRGSSVRPMLRATEAGEAEEEEDRESAAARACLDEARTCLQVCATLAHNELMTSLLEHGADINAAPGALGWSSLHLCAAVSNEEGAALLLKRGAVCQLEDVEGNTAQALAERAGHESVRRLLKEAFDSAPEVDPAIALAAVPTPSAARRNLALKGGALPPLHAGAPPMTEEAPEEEAEPLALWKEEWAPRESNGSLLDRAITPMVADALKCEVWRIRWEAMTYICRNFASVAGGPPELARAVAELLAVAAGDKIPKVFLAALGIFEELLSDSRMDAVSPDEFAKLLRGGPEESVADALLTLLDQTDAAGGSSNAASPQQAAAEALCSCVMHGRVPLDEVAWPLLKRIEERLIADASGGAAQDRKDKALGPKCLAANLKLLGRWLQAFGLQQSGLFRRALVLPLLLRATASEHSKVRVASGDAMVQLMALSGGLEERLWQLLPSKARKGVHRLAQEQEGISVNAAVPCEEDAMKKDVIVTEDARAGAFLCVSELTPQVWQELQAGERLQEEHQKKSSKKRQGKDRGAASEDEGAHHGNQALKKSLTSKNWKERADAVGCLARELSAPQGEGVRCMDDTDPASGPLLSQYVLRGHRISALQAYLGSLLSDTVTQVFCASADLLRIVCGHVPLYIAPLFLEPLVPPLVARLVDSSTRVRQKAQETTLEIASMHGCALSEMIAQCVASGSAWSSAPPPTPGGGGASSSSGDRAAGRDVQTGPRLQLLNHLVQAVHDQESAGRWTEETWQSLADYAIKAAEHRNGDVRKEAANIINSLAACGGVAGIIADRAVSQLQALAAQAKMQKRPGTMSTRPTTGSTRLGTGAGSRPGTGATLNASGRLSNLGSTGGFSGMGSTGRLSTASKRSGTGFRPGTGLNTGLRPGTGLHRKKDVDEESDNSVHSDTAPEVEALDDTPAGDDEGIKFFDVKTACPGADEAISLEEGETALREAIPLAEALDEVALDFVAPLVALFGDGWTRCFYSRQWQCRVAALTHLSASMSHRLEAISSPEVSPNALGELLDGAMRAVHEGLGDQNVRVYAEACLAVNHVVPAFCGAVDGRLLVAHLAPLLRQLCSRMGDSKEVVRLQTVQALFRLLRPPTGNIVSPIAIGMLILRHMAPTKEGEGADAGASRAAANDKGARVGWLCRIGALRDLLKEHTRSMVHQPGAAHPGEWLRLKDGLNHGDDLVRYESARLYALVCKVHLKSLGDEAAQKDAREAWVAALPPETPPKSLSQVRKLLKLPDDYNDEVSLAGSLRKGLNGSGKLGATSTALPSASAWNVPQSLAIWVGCAPDALEALANPQAGDEKAVAAALRTLGKAVAAFADAPKRRDSKPEEAFASLCRAIQQAMSSAVGGDRAVFLTAVELCQLCVSQLAPVLSGLDINMGLAKTVPTMMERTSITGTSDVKVGVASDKLVQQLAKHPKVGAEAVTKMVISAVGRTERPIRPLVLLRTLLSDFGLRLCAQRDVVSLLLGAAGTQLERMGTAEDADSVRPQLVGVLATVNQFSPETVQQCMVEVDPAHRKLITAALQEAPNPRLVALGATAAEQAKVQHLAGSAVRAASRDRRGPSPMPGDDCLDSPARRNIQASPEGRSRRPAGLPRGPEEASPEASPESRSRRPAGLPRGPEDLQGLSRAASLRQVGEASPGGLREASPRGSSSRRNRRVFRDEPADRGEASPAALADCGGASPSRSPPGPSRNGLGRHASAGSIGMGSPGADGRAGMRWGGGEAARPPAPMGLSTRLSGAGDASWEFNGQAASSSEGRRMQRAGSSDFAMGKEKSTNESLSSLMDVLSQMDNRNKSR